MIRRVKVDSLLTVLFLPKKFMYLNHFLFLHNFWFWNHLISTLWMISLWITLHSFMILYSLLNILSIWNLFNIKNGPKSELYYYFLKIYQNVYLKIHFPCWFWNDAFIITGILTYLFISWLFLYSTDLPISSLWPLPGSVLYFTL